MPHYSYKCKDCATRFEKQYPSRDEFVADSPACPKCQSHRVRTFYPAGLVSPSVQNGINRCNTYPYVSRRLPHRMAGAPHEANGRTVVLNKREEDRLAHAYGGEEFKMVRE